MKSYLPIRDFGAFHPRALLERDDVRRDFHVVFQFVVDFAGTVAVVEVCDMAVLLRFGDGQRADAHRAEIFALDAVDGRRAGEEAFRNMEVAVVFHHAGVDDIRDALAVKLVEFGPAFEGGGDFEGAVAAEVEIDDAVAVFDGSDGLAVFGDDEGSEILIDGASFLTVGFDGLMGGGELAAFAENMGLPAAFDHGPVGAVAVHRDVHAAAAGGDPRVAALQAFHKIFKRIDVGEGGCFTDVTAVQQDVDADLLDAFLRGFNHHRLQVVDVGMDVAVGEQTDEMQRGVLFDDIARDFLPGLAFEHLAGLDIVADELGALREDASGTDGVVADFGVAHVRVAGQTDGEAVGLQFRVRAVFEHPVQIGLVGGGDGVSVRVFAETDAVHDDEHDGALAAFEPSGFFQFVNHFERYSF